MTVASENFPSVNPTDPNYDAARFRSIPQFYLLDSELVVVMISLSTIKPLNVPKKSKKLKTSSLSKVKIDEDLDIIEDDLMQGSLAKPGSKLPKAFHDAVESLINEVGDIKNVTGSEIVEGKLLRLCPLTNASRLYVGVFVETLRGRDAINSAVSQYHLTKRESDIITCLARGDSNKMIAEDLSISPTTASDHVKNILKKMKCHSRPQLLVRIFGRS